MAENKTKAKKKRHLRLGFPALEIAHLTSKLNTLLANLNVHNQKMKSFHWNVEGDDFFELHDKFQEFYQTSSSSIDWVAERIRVFGNKPDGHLAQYLKNAEITESDVDSNPKEMVTATLVDFEIICDHLKICIDAANAMNDAASSVKLASFLENYQTQFWQLSVWNNRK